MQALVVDDSRAVRMMLKRMLEEIGRFVLWKASSTGQPDWADAAWRVTATFPELVNRDVAKFASAFQQVVNAVVIVIDAGLLTQERGLQLIGDVASRFVQDVASVIEEPALLLD